VVVKYTYFNIIKFHNWK